MATSQTPARTRSQAATPDDETLLTVLDELRQLREEQRRDAEEQQRFRDKLEARLRERDEALQRLQERATTRLEGPQTQLSPLHLPSARENPAENVYAESGAGAYGDRVTGPLRLKPDTYDGTAPLREFLSQFALIARANIWNEASKAVALASSLRGRARSILSTDDVESLTFAEIKGKLELQFGESELTQDYYLQFTNRRQRSGEDYATLGADLERLSRRAYSECTHAVRDKIACSQFVAALSDGFVKRSLQVEGITSLRLAIERAKTLKFINDSSFPRKREEPSSGPGSFKRKDPEITGEKGKQREERAPAKKSGTKGGPPKGKECWKCGAIGHFRSECPSASKAEN